MINKLTKEQIDSNKKEILTLLGNVKRKGMEEVMSFLENSTFFVAPNHRDNKKHHAWPGGIAQHSLGVYKLMKDARGLDHDSITITSLLHDICKANKYELYKDGNWHLNHTNRKYQGHGSLSVYILTCMCHLDLTPEERVAIQYHMHHNNPETNIDSKLHHAIHHCDNQNAKEND